MTRIDRIAAIISITAFLLCAFIAARIFENMPHIEDELAFTWQARVIERGKITVPTPNPYPDSLLVPFVVDYQGQRFAKYPIGWPVVLAIGEKVKARGFVNPILTGLAVWFIYRLVKKVSGERTALLAAGLTTLSPFVIMNGSSLLSHPWSLLLCVVFCISWLDAFTEPNPALPANLSRVIPAITAGLALGALALTRPWTAVGIAPPFLVHWIVLLIRGNLATRKRLLGTVILAGSVSSLYFVWQFVVTRSLLTNPYTLWWSYDKVGFGPGHGLQPGGYQPIHAWVNTLFSLYVGNTDMFGWPVISWLFMPLGLFSARRDKRIWLVSAILPSLVLAYSFYWMPSWLLGPRYYYEALIVPVLLTANGIAWVTSGALKLGRKSFPPAGVKRFNLFRFGFVAVILGLLLSGNILYYLPMRVGGLYGLYRISSRCLRPFQNADVLESTPALVFVHVQHKYNEYGCLQDLNSPYLDSNFLVVISQGPEINRLIASAYPGRSVLHYYPGFDHLLLAPIQPDKPSPNNIPSE